MSIDEIPDDLIVDFDLHDQTIAADVHQHLAAAHRAGPVTFSTAHGGYWLVTGYDEARFVLGHPEIFSSFPNSLPRSPALPKTIPIEIDPPEHAIYRDVIAPLFSPGRMRALEAQIRGLTNTLIDGFAARGECELVMEFAHPLPSGMFLALMGWPLTDLSRFVEWTDAIINPPAGISDEERAAIRQRAAASYAAYFQGVIDETRLHPDDSLTSAIVQAASNDARPITDDELTNMFGLLMIAGLHTVRGVIGHTVIALDARPDIRRQVTDDPSTIPVLVEEMLRLEAPASPGRRVATAVTLGGAELRAGDRILVSVPAANRDALEFPEPDLLRLDRETNRHLAFAAGPHRCAGSHLARVELRVATEELLRRIPDFRVVGTPRLHSGQVRGVTEINLRFTPSAVIGDG